MGLHNETKCLVICVSNLIHRLHRIRGHANSLFTLSIKSFRDTRYDVSYMNKPS